MKYLLIAAFLLFAVLNSSQRNISASDSTYKDVVFTNYLKTRSGWIAGDGAYSIPIGRDKSLWTFGDSYIDSYDTVTNSVPCLFQARNAAVFMDINDPSNQLTLRNYERIPTFFNYGKSNKFWFWPESGYQKDDTIFVFLSRLRATGDTGMWGFAGVDTNYIAKINTADPNKIYYSIIQSHGGINFGISVVADTKGFNYIYGIKSNGFGNDLFVARVHQDNIYDNWQYFSDGGWTKDISKIRKIDSEFTASIYILKLKSIYILITTEFSVGCDQGKNIYISTSDNPAGPFTNKHSVWQVDDTILSHYPMFYMANAHPEYDNGKEELLITYCINGYGDCLKTCTDNRMDPDIYRPKAIRVPFKLIDKSL